MPTNHTQMRITNSFLKSLRVAEKMAGPIFPQCAYSFESFNENTFHPTVASKIFGLAFLSIVAALEEYVELAFMGYMCGARSHTGVRTGTPCLHVQKQTPREELPHRALPPPHVCPHFCGPSLHA